MCRHTYTYSLALIWKLYLLGNFLKLSQFIKKLIKHEYIYIKNKNTQNLLRDKFGSENITKENKKVITIIVRLMVTLARRVVYDQK